jgi:hypothetical protein
LARTRTVVVLATISLIAMSTPVAATPVPVDLSTWTAHNQPYTGPASTRDLTVDGSEQSVAHR